MLMNLSSDWCASRRINWEKVKFLESSYLCWHNYFCVVYQKRGTAGVGTWHPTRINCWLFS